MKYKWQTRAFGAYQTVLFSAFGGPVVHYTVFSDTPIYVKIGYGILSGLGVLGVIDGVTDVVKGTHHYFSMKLVKRLAEVSGHQKTADRIQSEIDYMLVYRERHHPFFRRARRN